MRWFKNVSVHENIIHDDNPNQKIIEIGDFVLQMVKFFVIGICLSNGQM